MTRENSQVWVIDKLLVIYYEIQGVTKPAIRFCLNRQCRRMTC